MGAPQLRHLPPSDNQVISGMFRYHGIAYRQSGQCDGGETTLWQDGATTLDDLITEAKDLGFFSVQVVTNGTQRTNIPGADLVFLSLDGTEATHDRSARLSTLFHVGEEIEAGPTHRLMAAWDRRLRRKVALWELLSRDEALALHPEAVLDSMPELARLIQTRNAECGMGN